MIIYRSTISKILFSTRMRAKLRSFFVIISRSLRRLSYSISPIITDHSEILREDTAKISNVKLDSVSNALRVFQNGFIRGSTIGNVLVYNRITFF